MASPAMDIGSDARFIEMQKVVSDGGGVLSVDADTGIIALVVDDSFSTRTYTFHPARTPAELEGLVALVKSCIPSK